MGDWGWGVVFHYINYAGLGTLVKKTAEDAEYAEKENKED